MSTSFDPMAAMDAWLDESITIDEHAALDGWLAQDVEHVRQLAARALLHRHLLTALASEAPMAPVATRPPLSVRRFAAPIALAAAVALAITAWFIVNSGLQPAAQSFGPSSAPPVALLSDLSADAVFSESSEDGLMSPGSDLCPGPIHLTAGKAQILFKSTAVVELIGPCDFEIAGDNHGVLRRGRISVHVPPAARGFAVAGAGVRVIDLGTEFVMTSTDDRVDVKVFKGRVRVESIAGRFAPMMVEAGHGVHRIAGAGGDSTWQATELSAQAIYSHLVMSLNPQVYLPMTRSDDSQNLINEASPASSGRIVRKDATSPFAEGIFGDALALRGAAYGDYAELPHYRHSRTGQVTVSAWIYPTAYVPWASIAKNWGSTVHGQFHLGLSEFSTNLAAYVGQSDGEQVGVQEGVDHPLTLNQWHHVAMVADGKTLALYRDGRCVATAPCGPVLLNPPVDAVAIGVKLDDQNTAPVGEYWQGRLDEIAVFDHALTEAEIHQLTTTNLPEIMPPLEDVSRNVENDDTPFTKE